MNDAYKCKYLTGTRLKVFLAAADCIIPPDGDTPGGGTMATAGIVDWSLDRLEPELRKKLLLLFLILQPLGMFFGGRTFTKTSARNRERLLKWMESNPVSALRLGFFGIKTYICMGYYTRDDIWKTIGYEGPVRANLKYPDETIRALAERKLEVIS
jgi:hypothetical protein